MFTYNCYYARKDSPSIGERGEEKNVTLSSTQCNINDKITEPFYFKVSLLLKRVFIFKTGHKKLRVANGL